MRFFGVLLIALYLFSPVLCEKKKYDHQTKTYHAHHNPVTVDNARVTITPYFSPDYSVPTTVKLIQNAEHSIDIITPSWGTWIGCGFHNHSGCVGCSVDEMKYNYKFPVFPALLNAHHRGVRVRVLTNDYEENLCSGMVDGIQYLKLAGIEVRAFTTVTFNHIKHVAVDGKKAAVSSINFSKTSFTKNREAGLVIENNAEIVGFLHRVFEDDWQRAYDFPVDEEGYSAAQLEEIRSIEHMEVKLPRKHTFSCETASPKPKAIEIYPSDGVQVTAFTSPDYALETMMKQLNTTRTSFTMEMYQINQDDLCNKLIDMHNQGIDIKLLVSDMIYSYGDWKTTQVCYRRMAFAGIPIRKTARDCLTFSHQKYWIVDDSWLGISTGNWSPTDYPAGDMDFPPHGDNEAVWRKTNRDFTILVKGSQAVLDVFKRVFQTDYDQSYEYDPYNSASY